MQSGRYCITSPTIAVLADEGRHVAGLVPKGAIIEIPTEVLDDNKLISVVWDGQEVMMFVQDLQRRAELVEASIKDRRSRRSLAARTA